jgi:hypothetical protein
MRPDPGRTRTNAEMKNQEGPTRYTGLGSAEGGFSEGFWRIHEIKKAFQTRLGAPLRRSRRDRAPQP